MEAELLRHICARRVADPRVRVGPGDDLAVLTDGLMVGVDQVVEGRHFESALLADLAAGVPRVAAKAINRNLSDVAAMGGLPLAMVVAATLPADWSGERAAALSDALRGVTAAAEFSCPIVGGDIAVHDGPLVLAVTVLAREDGVPAILRSGARPGDLLCVTGALGGSLESGRHLDFCPRLDAGRRLASGAVRPTAMMDLSDGLAADLPRLLEASGVGARVDLARLPRHAGVGWAGAWSDGEDYELLFAWPAERAAVPASLGDVPVSSIGVIASEPGLRVRTEAGDVRDAADLGPGLGGWLHGEASS